MNRTHRRAAAITAALVVFAAVPAAAIWKLRARDYNARSTAADFTQDLSLGEEGWLELSTAAHPDRDGADEGDEPGGIETDDPRRRAIASRALFGRFSPEARRVQLQLAEAEVQRWGGKFATPQLKPGGGVQNLAGDFGERWLPIGPTDTPLAWNGTDYAAVDSGRVTGILADPANPNVVIVSTSGGGIWKTTDITAATPNWTSLADTLGNLAIGAIAADPANFNTLYAGLGDFVDTEGGQVVKSTDGGASWGTAVTLEGTSPGGKQEAARSIREIRVSPANPQVVLVGTDLGLFRSTDGGASFVLVDLPNAQADLLEGIWSVASAGGSRLVVSGVAACDPGRRPPSAGGGLTAGATIPGTDPAEVCANGNPGEIWVSTDNGANWVNRATAGSLPSRQGRITLAAAPAGDPTTATIYAYVGAEDDSDHVAYWRSTDGGNSFAVATGTLTNSTAGSSDCSTPLVGSQQAWYNQALAVDPADPAHVVAGGMLCGVRSANANGGTPSWENMAHWLPAGGGGNTQAGTLPYVHADWHRLLVVHSGSLVRVLAGTDGGIYYADDVFTASPPSIGWKTANRGLQTHLSYAVGSGDPATGNPYVAFTGLQDNGTRMRVGASSAYNQVIGGDGIGVAALQTRNGKLAYLASVNGSRQICYPSSANEGCTQGGSFDQSALVKRNCPSEGDPFFIRYSPVLPRTDARIALTATNRSVYRSVDNGTKLSWALVSPCLTSPERAHIVRNVSASGNHDGLFGAALSGGRFAVTSDCQGEKTDCVWTVSSPMGKDADGNGTLSNDERIFFANYVDFPPGDTGKALGEVYVAVSGAPVTQADRPVPASLGHVFLTQDRGTTFTSIQGDLPNVPVHVVRYDPHDPTNQTIYVGNDFGVYRTTNGGTNWTRFGVLPMVRVVDMYLSPSGALFRIGTYGRGLWEMYPAAVTKVASGGGDFDADGAIDFFDVANTAARLGTTPATDTLPPYDWRLDVTTNTTIDDADLAATLASLGSTR